MADLSNILCVDLETTGLDWMSDRIHGIATCRQEDSTSYSPPQIGIKDLSDPELDKLGHNLRFDLRFLMSAGIAVQGKWWDTKILAQLLDENQPLGLKPLSLKYLGPFALENKSDLDRVLTHMKMKHVGELCAYDLNSKDREHFELISCYAQEDVNNTYRLCFVLMQKLLAIHNSMKDRGKTPLDYYIEEAMPLERVLLKMEMRGIRVDLDKIAVMRNELEQDNDRILEDMNNLVADQIDAIESALMLAARAKRISPLGKANVEKSSSKYKTKFNFQSATHMASLIFTQLKCPTRFIKKTKGGGYSTDESTLKKISMGLVSSSEHSRLVELLDLYARYKKNTKMLITYIGDKKGLSSHIRPVGQIHRVYPEYFQVGRGKESSREGTVTGRLSAKNPPIQTLPRRGNIRNFFIPDTDDHCFLYLDYSQLELRIAAHLSQDKNLILAYKTGLDVHTQTAEQIYDSKEISGDQRQVGKTTNFATIFDASPWILAREFTRNGLQYTEDQCREFIKGFFGQYPQYREYLRKEKIGMIQRRGVVSEAGRIRRLPELAIADYMNWRRRSYEGPLDLILYKNEKGLPSDQIYNRARKRLNHAVKQGYNYPIQSLGATITKRAMIELDRLGYDIVTQVHDMILIQILKKDIDCASQVQNVMENAYQLSVPLVAEYKLLNSLSEKDTYIGEENGTRREHM